MAKQPKPRPGQPARPGIPGQGAGRPGPQSNPGKPTRVPVKK